MYALRSLHLYQAYRLFCFVEKTKKRKKKKIAESNPLQIKKGETKKQFFRRLDGEVNEALNKAMMQTKKLRGKRKE